MQSLDHAALERLARIARIDLPEDRIALVAERLSELVGMAAVLDELPLDGVAPAMTFDPEWQKESA
ncbi:MAG: hypothetical protein C4346_19775 [Chloroflexota bacterium]